MTLNEWQTFVELIGALERDIEEILACQPNHMAAIDLKDICLFTLADKFAKLIRRYWKELALYFTPGCPERAIDETATAQGVNPKNLSNFFQGN